MSVSVDEEKPAIGAFSPGRRQVRSAERQTSKIRKDPHRRRRFLAHVQSDATIVRGALATLIALIDHSDDTAGPAWPSQARLARLVGVDARTVRRHLAELRDAGYLLVFVYGANRDPATGRYSRRRTNRYYFTFCKEPGNGRRIRRKGRSHLQDSHVLSNPHGMSNHRPSGGGGGSSRLIIEGIDAYLPKRKANSTPTGTDPVRFVILDEGFDPDDALPNDPWSFSREHFAAARAQLDETK